MHAVGGLGPDGVSDTGEHTVLTAAGWVTRAPMPNPRNHLGAAAIGSVLYVVGGRHGWDEAAGDQSSLHEYDPATDSWRERAPFPQPASEIAASTFATSSGNLIVVGGSVAGAHPTAAVFIYDPNHDSWGRLPDLPEPRKGAVAAQIGDEIIVTWRGCCLR
jgi:N-acetylneuraminic acid mutarotase